VWSVIGRKDFGAAGSQVAILGGSIADASSVARTTGQTAN